MAIAPGGFVKAVRNDIISINLCGLIFLSAFCAKPCAGAATWTSGCRTEAALPIPLPTVGFWSYSRDDDGNAHGCSVTQRMRPIQPGKFTMGSPKDEPGGPL